jgi:rubrerythrin
MDTFTADLDRVTAGDYASHYLDDENFNYAVSQMEDLGHNPERTADALREWISGTPMWDCPECGLEGIDEDFADCPVCGQQNPSVVVISGGN